MTPLYSYKTMALLSLYHKYWKWISTYAETYVPDDDTTTTNTNTCNTCTMYIVQVNRSDEYKQEEIQIITNT